MKPRQLDNPVNRLRGSLPETPITPPEPRLTHLRGATSNAVIDLLELLLQLLKHGSNGDDLPL